MQPQQASQKGSAVDRMGDTAQLCATNPLCWIGHLHRPDLAWGTLVADPWSIRMYPAPPSPSWNPFFWGCVELETAISTPKLQAMLMICVHESFTHSSSGVTSYLKHVQFLSLSTLLLDKVQIQQTISHTCLQTLKQINPTFLSENNRFLFLLANLPTMLWCPRKTLHGTCVSVYVFKKCV